MEAITTNDEAIEAWDGVLFDRFTRYRHLIVTALEAHGERALAADPPHPGERVIDIGCGFGDTTQRIAEIVGPAGAALGVDAAPRFIAQSIEEAAAAGSTARFEVADVESTVPGEGFDRAFSRMGTMFFANPVAAMRNIRAALVSGGRLSMVVWRQKPDNEFMHRAELVTERFLTHPEQTDEPTCGPGPFSMANADTTSGILTAAGFERVGLERCDLPILMGSDLDEAIELITAIGPAGELIRVNEEHGEELRGEIEAAIREDLAELVRPDGSVWGGSSTWIVTARVPAAA